MRGFLKVLWILLLLPSGLQAEEKVVPEDWSFRMSTWLMVSEQPKLTMRLGIPDSGDREKVDLHVSVLGMAKGGLLLSEEQVELFRGVMGNAVRGVEDRAEGEGRRGVITFATFKTDQEGLGVRIKRLKVGQELSPEQVRYYQQKIEEMFIGRRWYRELLAAKEVPEMRDDLRPPRVNNASTFCLVGELFGGELGFRSTVEFHGGGSVSSHWSLMAGRRHSHRSSVTRELQSRLFLAAESLERGEEYTYELERKGLPDSGSVVADVAAGIVRISFTDHLGKTVEGRFTLKDVRRIEEIDELARERHKWFMANRHLLYECHGHLLPPSINFEVVLDAGMDRGRKNGIGNLSIVLSAKRSTKYNGMVPVELEVLCQAFPSGLQQLSEDDLKMMNEAARAAEDKRNYRGVANQGMATETVYTAQERFGVWVATMKRGSKGLVVDPESRQNLEILLKRAEVAQAWYAKLQGFYEFPEETVEAMRPEGDVLVRVGAGYPMRMGPFGVSYWVELHSDGVQRQLVYLDKGHGRDAERLPISLTGDFIKQLLKAGVAIREKRDFAWSQGDVQKASGLLEVSASREQGGVLLEYHPYWADKEEDPNSTLKCVLNDHSLKQIEKLLPRMEKRSAWLREHEGLFFRHK
ncbi:hypothetical protein Rhal01_02181 [Rubritalea halochordaticola]|uniref:SLA1 homology domain-containing protein n=2 Tax=Rubritalea halochordaticola TaxID=714537 RepID=A0ABP9V1Y2_9BACT